MPHRKQRTKITIIQPTKRGILPPAEGGKEIAKGTSIECNLFGPYRENDSAVMQSAATKQISAVPPMPNGKGDAAVVPQKIVPKWLPSFLTKALPSNWERVTVNKNIDSVTMPKWVAIVVLGAILTFAVGAWYRAGAEHDTLIEIKTELRLAKEAQAEKDRMINGKLNDLDAWKDVMNGNLKKIEGMLTQAQIESLDRYKQRPKVQ